MPKKMKFTEFFFRQGEASERGNNSCFPLSGKVAKLSVSEILPIEDKKADLSTAATRQSLPEGEAKQKGNKKL